MFNLEERFAQQIIAHAREEAPNECVGILGGAGGQVLSLYRGINAEHSPRRYSLDPKDLYRIHRDLDDHGWEVVGIYHSHPQAGAYFSDTDLKLAFWTNAVYIVVSLLDPGQPEMRAYRVVAEKAVEEELNIGPDTPR
ncbi:MAG: M67 family metallopeptidase [Chloroflexi bacterium]|nr:M67 family metallopeptidase [Chloroflexota bacterium]